MRPSSIRYAVLGTLSFGLLSITLPAAGLASEPSTKGMAKTLTVASKDPILQKNEKIRKLLRSLVDFPRYDDPKTTFAEMLEILACRYDIPFQINEIAFVTQGVADISNQPVATKPLPPLSNVPLHRVLDCILARVGESCATFLVHDGMIEITTRQAAAPVNWIGPQGRMFAPTVSTTFEEQRLDVALQELSSRSGIDIVLDRRNSTAASMPSVSAHFHQMPVDTAVRLLADMSGLRAIAVDAALYVTSKENAEKLRKQVQQEQEDAPPITRVGPMG